MRDKETSNHADHTRSHVKKKKIQAKGTSEVSESSIRVSRAHANLESDTGPLSKLKLEHLNLNFPMPRCTSLVLAGGKNRVCDGCGETAKS